MQLRRARDEAGAISIIVALLLGPVLLGMGALVVDIGALYADRRQQQTAADAASLAVAHDCALNLTNCAGVLGQPGVTAQDYSSGGGGVPGSKYSPQNRSSHVDYVCGTAVGLTPCTPSQTANCTGSVPSFPYVQVRTRSADSSGAATLLPTRFARALAGNSGDAGHDTTGCARAAYGAVRATQALALTISFCEWNAATSGGTVFAPEPPYPPNPAGSFEQVLQLHGSGTTDCGGGASGWDLPGGFGWLDDTTGTCTAYVDVTDTYHDNTGVSASQPCRDKLVALGAYPPAEPTFLPIYDGTQGNGSNGTYHLKGYAAFVVTGFSISGNPKQASWLTGVMPCKGSNKCVSGFFVKALLPSGGVLGGPGLGASIVKLVS